MEWELQKCYFPVSVLRKKKLFSQAARSYLYTNVPESWTEETESDETKEINENKISRKTAKAHVRLYLAAGRASMHALQT